MANNPNVGPEPVEARPNHVREKTFKEPNTPALYEESLNELPEKEAESKVREQIPDAVEGVKKGL